MELKVRRQIFAIAEQVRKWAEARAAETRSPNNLQGMCAIASAELWRQLAGSGIAAKIRVWEDDKSCCHAFLVVGDNILCVTATQFSALRDKRIYFAHEKEAEIHKFFNHSYEFDTPKELVKWQRKVNFTRWQIAEA